MKLRISLDIEIEDPRVVDYLLQTVRNDTVVNTDDGSARLPDVLTDCLVAAVAPEMPDDREPVADHIYYAFFEENWLLVEVRAERGNASCEEL